MIWTTHSLVDGRRPLHGADMNGNKRPWAYCRILLAVYNLSAGIVMGSSSSAGLLGKFPDFPCQEPVIGGQEKSDVTFLSALCALRGRFRMLDATREKRILTRTATRGRQMAMGSARQ